MILHVYLGLERIALVQRRTHGSSTCRHAPWDTRPTIVRKPKHLKEQLGFFIIIIISIGTLGVTQALLLSFRS